MDWVRVDDRPFGKSSLGFPACAPSRCTLEALPGIFQDQDVRHTVLDERRDLLSLSDRCRWPRSTLLLAYFPFLVLAVVDLYQRMSRDSRPFGRRLWNFAIVSLVMCSLVFVTEEAYTMYWRRDLDRTARHIKDGKKIFLLKTGLTTQPWAISLEIRQCCRRPIASILNGVMSPS